MMPQRAKRRQAASIHARIGVMLVGLVALWLGGAREAHAPPPISEAVDDPKADRVWAGCKLPLNTINAIKAAVDQGNIGASDFSFGVVYARTKPNNGQPLTASSGGGLTGPVVCIPQTSPGIAIEKTTEEENIPTAEDQGVADVAVLDAAEALVARYSFGPGPTVENRFCHIVSNPTEAEPPFQPPESSTDCFRLFAGGLVDEPVAAPVSNRVWAGCTLNTATVNDIKSAIQLGKNIDDPSVEVSYLVVYSNNNGNNGQPLTGGGATGPAICTAPGVLIENTTESEDVPNSADQPGVASVNLLDTSEALVIRYGYGNPLSGPKESRFCQTVASSDTTGALTNPPPETNTDCFRVFPSQ